MGGRKRERRKERRKEGRKEGKKEEGREERKKEKCVCVYVYMSPLRLTLPSAPGLKSSGEVTTGPQH